MTPIAASINHSELGTAKMKTYSQFVQESSLSRIRGKMDKKGPTVHISGERSGMTKAQKKKAKSTLKGDLGRYGLRDQTTVKGKYKEAGQEKANTETTIVARGRGSKKKTRKAAAMIAKKHKQDAIIQSDDKGKGKQTLVATTKDGRKDLGKKRTKIGKMKPGTTADMETRVNNRPYTMG